MDLPPSALLIAKSIIEQSGLFDAEWYLRQYPDVAEAETDPLEHFIAFGGFEGRNPSSHFNTSFYLATSPDVASAPINPLLHYVLHGRQEGRRCLPSALHQPLIETSKPSADTGNNKSATAGPILFISGEAIDRPGYFYRVERAAAAMKQAGFSALAIHRSGIDKHLDAIPRAPFVFIWRATWAPDIARMLEIAKRNGVKVVFDLDDLMVRLDLVHEKFIDAIRFNRRDPSQVADLYAKIVQTLAAADVCTATTPELAWQMRSVASTKPTFVIPNGYAEQTYITSRLGRRSRPNDGLIRIGYASGSRTHQADFKRCVSAVAEVLRRHENCRLVLFRLEELRGHARPSGISRNVWA